MSDSYGVRMHNHLENNYNLGNKKALYHNMTSFMGQQGKEVFDYLPVTFHIIKDFSKDEEYTKFLSYYK